MKKMQRSYLKIVGMLLILVVVFVTDAFPQAPADRLYTADSLFRAKRFTQSFEEYHKLYGHHQYTAAMFLKMAFIQEGLNHVGQAMYYLNLYHLASHDKTAIQKMEELAGKHDLQGYTITDKDKLLSLYKDYQFSITLFLAALSVLLLSFSVYSKTKQKSRPIATSVVLVCVLIIFFVHINYSDWMSKGIVSESETYLMEGPSAGAPVVAVVNEGHRVEVIGKKDIWLKILWNDEVAYIKENRVLPIEL